MTTLRDAAQQALEALEWHLDRGTWGADLEGCAANLRAALEQEQAEPEPVAWMVYTQDGKSAYVTDNPTDIVDEQRALPLYAALEQEQAEPVAWRTFDGEGGFDYRDYEGNEGYAAEWAQRNPSYAGWVEPLYTAPPPCPHMRGAGSRGDDRSGGKSMRPDYCPIGGQPCQRMCVTPCKAPPTQEPNNPGECSECHAPVGSVCSDSDCPGKAAPLITKPADFVSLLREADEIVRAKPTWRRFIDGTPLSNDIAVWMVVFAQDVARRNADAALRADADRYRYLLGHARRIDVAGWSISHMEQLSPRIDAARDGS